MAQAVEARRDAPGASDAARRDAPSATTPKRETPRAVETSAALPHVDPVPSSEFKDAFLEEVRRQKKFFHGTVIAQAQRIDVEGDRINFVFAPQHRALRATLEQTRPLLETIAAQLAGRRMAVAALEGQAAAASKPAGDAAGQAAEPDRKAALHQQALKDSSVQAMLDVFGAEIKEVEER
jgi:hypothetical protein